MDGFEAKKYNVSQSVEYRGTHVFCQKWGQAEKITRENPVHFKMMQTRDEFDKFSSSLQMQSISF